MKCSIFCFSLLFFSTAFAQNKPYFPQPVGFVNDFEKDFSATDVHELDLMVKKLLVKTMETDSLQGIEIAIVTVTDSMYGNEKEMSDYARDIADTWDVGAKPPKRGIVIAYSRDVRKVGIAVGEGLAKLLPPAACQDIISQKMTAQFHKGDPYGAFVAGISGIAEYLGISLK